ncbi:hypothetical protein ABHI18_003739 [Aspergillus niger]
MEAHSAHSQQTLITPNRSDPVSSRQFLSVAVPLWAYHKSVFVSMFGFESFSGRGCIENHSALPDSCRQTFEEDQFIEITELLSTKNPCSSFQTSHQSLLQNDERTPADSIRRSGIKCLKPQLSRHRFEVFDTGRNDYAFYFMIHHPLCQFATGHAIFKGPNSRQIFLRS